MAASKPKSRRMALALVPIFLTGFLSLWLLARSPRVEAPRNTPAIWRSPTSLLPTLPSPRSESGITSVERTELPIPTATESRDLLSEALLTKNWAALNAGATEKIRESPKDPHGWYLLHMALIGQHSDAQAREALETALELNPTYFDAAIEWTHLYAKAISPKDLRGQWIGNGFSDTQVLALLGMQGAVQGDHAGAIELYHQSLDIDNYNPVTRIALADLHSALGHSEEAVAELRLAYRIDPTQIGAGLEAVAMLRIYGQKDSADSLLDEILSEQPLLLGGREGIEAWMSDRIPTF